MRSVRWREGVLAVALAMGMPTCRGKARSEPAALSSDAASPSGACARDPAVHARFALGTTPHYPVHGLYGEAAKCWIEFQPGPVIEVRDGVPVLVAEGKFGGTCNGEPYGRRFESVRVASLKVEQMSTNNGLGKLGDLVLDSAHPDWTISIRVRPLDDCGQVLDSGRGVHGSWKPRADCAATVKVEGYDIGADADLRQPHDEIKLSAVQTGKCTIDVGYLGRVTHTEIAIR